MSELNQLELLFDRAPVNDPELLHPATVSIDTDPAEFHNRSPTLNQEQEKLARSLHRKSRELVKRSRCFKPENKDHEDLQQHEHP